MAMNTNTTKTVKRTSTVLAAKCEATQKNMKRLLRLAGCAEDVKMEKVMVPMNPGDKDDVIYVGINGSDFYFKRGEPVNMPEPAVKILRCAHVLK